MKNLTHSEWLLVLLVVCFAPWIASARLGETPEQLDARFGKPVFTDKFVGLPMRTYVSNDFQVMVAFQFGKSALEMWRPEDPARSLSEREYLALANGVAGAGQWELYADGSPKIWKRGTNYFASFLGSAGAGDSLTVATCGMFEYVATYNDRLASQKAGSLSAPVGGQSSGSAATVAPSGVSLGTNSYSFANLAIASDSAPAKATAEEKRADVAAKLLKFHREQAAKGDPYGQLRMGERYLAGDGVERDVAKARAMFEKSAAQGNEQAAAALRKLPSE